MKEQIVVQLPLILNLMDFDALISVEEGLIDLFKDNRGVDVEGHDIGRGRFNVFIHSDEPWPSNSWGASGHSWNFAGGYWKIWPSRRVLSMGEQVSSLVAVRLQARI